MVNEKELIFRLILATILGGLIGIEREITHRPAGLRTHILVTVGSALIMLVSMNGFLGGDPGRLAAQVVSGIGFLGAGTILREGNDVSGLTTAASLWVSGGIGLAIGNGYYLGGLVTTIIVLFSLFSLRIFENQIFKYKVKKIKIICYERIGLLADITTVMSKNGIIIKELKFSNNNINNSDVNNKIVIKFSLKIPNSASYASLISELSSIDAIEKIL